MNSYRSTRELEVHFTPFRGHNLELMGRTGRREWSLFIARENHKRRT